jgi:UTP-glucose-1-phosphate uridylyltransferase
MSSTLLILAAGMGSRYGGLKQLDELGPHGETIMDYSVSDAVNAGFDRVVFVIRKSMKTDFEKIILSKYKNKVEVACVFQELDVLPKGFASHPDREKPYGTAHAILCAKDVIHTPFAVINADDFYGADAYFALNRFFKEKKESNKPQFAMAGYQLQKTLSENGTVSRGVCTADENDFLLSIHEMTHIQRTPNGIKNCPPNEKETLLDEYLPVSMNCWGFTPDIFHFLEEQFIDFLKNNHDYLTAEYTIPAVINHLLVTKEASIKVLKSNAEWFGVTYQADRDRVVEKLKKLNR